MKIKYFAASILVAIGLWGCGAETEQAQPVGGLSGQELAENQVLRWGNGAEPGSLDPHRTQGVPGSNIGRDLFEGLMSEAPDGTVIAGAAESWEISDDGKTYRFSLRPEARWSNGDPVTADDFVYSLRRSLDPATLSNYTFILNPILNAEAAAAGQLPTTDVGVRALDTYTLEIQLENTTPYFLGLLTHSASYPVHPPSAEAHGNQYARPGNLVSNGAYRLEEWVVQSHVKLVRNENYWDNANTTINEVWYYPTEDQTAELSRFRAGELDLSNAIPKRQVDWIRENLPDELVISPYLGAYYFGFNVTRPPFQNSPELRRALALAVDREIIAGQVTNAGEVPAYGWVPPVQNYTGQQMPEAAWTQQERVQEARRLYALAGYSEENPLRTRILYNTQEDHKRIAVAIASMWKQTLGVEVEILNQEWKVFLDTRQQMIETEIYRSGWIGDYNDAYTFAELFASGSGLNHTGYASPDYDRLLREASAEGDMKRRAELLQQAERVLLEDLPIMPLYFYVTARMVRPWVGGFTPNIMDHHRSKNFHILKH